MDKSEKIVPGEWYPERDKWFVDCKENRWAYDEALALLMVNEFIYASWCKSAGEGQTIGLYLNCNDTFYLAGDGEELPLVGFGDIGEKTPFWDLYERVRLHGYYGAVQWIAIKRQMRPLLRTIEGMKKEGAWNEEMEALPRRE